ncbi:hypothetical protein [Hymenobacter bucti]|uniref:Uncharacterized protein n=1 Tax=Hymenobacter bucti TaxID=1844114 RepID=A0ABW4QPM6_9BACT
MPLPRMRQLRRDKTLFGLAMNAVRLHLEEHDRLAQQPQLREEPDDILRLIQQSIDQWVGLATSYLMGKFRCSTTQAMELLGELLADMKAGIPVGELRQVPFQHALALPRELLAEPAPGQPDQPPAAAE